MMTNEDVVVNSVNSIPVSSASVPLLMMFMAWLLVN
jgi:hypothetical protein